jgi:hypothetical protein
MEKFHQMSEIFNELEDVLKLYHHHGDPAAAKKARNRLLKIRRLARQLRAEINSNPSVSKFRID